MFCCALLYVHSSIAIILMRKRELIALLNLSSWCLVMVERLFLAVPRGCLQFVIVVFPDHTHLLFLIKIYHVVQELRVFAMIIVTQTYVWIFIVHIILFWSCADYLMSSLAAFPRVPKLWLRARSNKPNSSNRQTSYIINDAFFCSSAIQNAF